MELILERRWSLYAVTAMVEAMASRMFASWRYIRARDKSSWVASHLAEM